MNVPSQEDNNFHISKINHHLLDGNFFLFGTGAGPDFASASL